MREDTDLESDVAGLRSSAEVTEATQEEVDAAIEEIDEE